MNRSRKALGRGLSALIPEAPRPRPEEAPPAAIRDFYNCPIERLRPNRNQPRHHFDEARLQELVRSVAEQGVIQPLVVRPLKDGEYEIIAGERRWRAAQKAALREVPVVIRDVSEPAAFEMALVENIQRADLNPIEEAEAYERLLAEHSYTQEQLATRVGKDRSTITNSLRLLKLPEITKRALIGGTISAGHGRALLGLEQPSLIANATQQAVKGELSVRQTETLVKRLRDQAERKADTPQTKSANIRDLEERLSRSLKTRVLVHQQRGNRGRIEIRYASLDELDRLLENLLPS
jgi:ParB family chromosome partitioning protein